MSIPHPWRRTSVQNHQIRAASEITVRVLGPVWVDGARGPIPFTHIARATELVTALALAPSRFERAMWPDCPTIGDVHVALARVRQWLGESRVDGIELRGVTSDWAQFLALVPGPAQATPTPELMEAISLVRGRPFEGVDLHRYGWATDLRAQMSVHVADAAQELAERLTKDDHPCAERVSALARDVSSVIWLERS